MALLTNKGYVKIEDVTPNKVTYYTFKDKATRDLAKLPDGKDDMSKFPKIDVVKINVDYSQKADSTKSLKDNILVFGYNALKNVKVDDIKIAKTVTQKNVFEIVEDIL